MLVVYDPIHHCRNLESKINHFFAPIQLFNISNLFIAHEGDGVGTSSVLCDADVDATDDHQVGTFLWKEALMKLCHLGTIGGRWLSCFQMTVLVCGQNIWH